MAKLNRPLVAIALALLGACNVDDGYYGSLSDTKVGAGVVGVARGVTAAAGAAEPPGGGAATAALPAALAVAQGAGGTVGGGGRGGSGSDEVSVASAGAADSRPGATGGDGVAEAAALAAAALERDGLIETGSGAPHLAHHALVRKALDVELDTLVDYVEELGGNVDTSGLLAEQLGVYSVLVPAEVDLEDTIEQLEASGLTTAAERDYAIELNGVPNDPRFSEQWGMSKIHAPLAWDRATGTREIIAAVLDTGLDMTHPDLAASLYTNPGEIPDNGLDDDANGFVDDAHGWDFANGDNVAIDDHGHGTHVSGIIGAQGNDGVGVAGVSWRVTILPIKVCSQTRCLTSWLASGLLYAARVGANVVNMSLGGAHAALSYEHNAIAAAGDAGILAVAAAGNSTWNIDQTPVYPAAYSLPNLVSIAATDSGDGLASYSNFGTRTVHLAAPGSDILSCAPGGGYQYMSGTSMAAPHVTGAAALALSLTPSTTPSTLKALLMASAERLPALSGRVATGGRLALTSLLGATAVCDGCDCAPGSAACEPEPTCADEPCSPDADCSDVSGSVECTCHEGYTGDGYACSDEDECAEGTAGCSLNAHCSNLPGSFRCECFQGLLGDGHSCEDVDECELDLDACPNGTDCNNTVGSYHCECSDGYVASGGTCEDLDECLEGLHSCDPHATCTNGLGSYTCTCDEGYAGDGFYCEVVQPCEPGDGTCAAEAACTELGWGWACVCGAGLEGDGRSCRDKDECAREVDACDENADCTNQAPGYSCSCRSGYEGDGRSCSDVDECALGLDLCQADAECQNLPGGYSCVCSEGYAGNGQACTDVDECAEGTDTCDPHADCVNTVGGFACRCRAGYEGSGLACLDVDECARGLDTCIDSAACVNTPGGFGCTCREGYSGDGVDCEDIDECASGAADCSPDATCTNTEGGYTCQCKDGLVGDGTSCEDVDECILEPGACDQNSTCTNTFGNHRCECLPGFEGGGLICEDIDECQHGWENCGVGANCKNTPGSYVCVCKPGFRGNGGGKCNPVDECAEAADDCHALATCVDTEQGFDCICPSGYAGDGTTCADIDECAGTLDDCDEHATCTNTPGGFACACKAGYVGDGRRCSEVDECALGLDDCSALADCTDLPGGFSCSCRAGYSGDGVACSDLDECARGLDDCSELAVCTNTSGSYTCACLTGYVGDGRGCTTPGDTNECALGLDDCSDNATCTNTEGSFACRCIAGYEGNGVTCTDIDECARGLDVCSDSATCANTPGSYACQCNPGFVGNGLSCLPPSACEDGADDCSDLADCIDTDSGFECRCRAGYTGNGVRCTDVDECEAGLDACDANADCENTAGSYECTCRAPYVGNGRACALDECALGLDDCHRLAACRDTASGYQCVCPAGYSGDGRTCANVDECALALDQCDDDAACTDRDGSYLCTCPADWSGDGSTCVPPPLSVLALDSGGLHTCALLDNGTVRCWGAGEFGQLGYGHTEDTGDDESAESPEPLSFSEAVVQVAAGAGHTCAVLESGAVQCWGHNGYGQLGLGHTEDIGDDELASDGDPIALGSPVRAVAVGGEHTCALLESGGVTCWGLGINGQLGYGNPDSIGDDELPSGQNLVALPRPATQIVAGRDHSCALLDSGDVKCWGRATWGQLGYGTTRNIGDDESVASLGAVPLGARAIQLSAGWYDTCAIVAGGGVRCWGYGRTGQLGYGDDENIGDNETPATVGSVALGGPAVSVDAGLYHTCAVLEGQSVRCWGYGVSGRLGYANAVNLGDNETLADVGDVDVGGSVVEVVAGYSHTCALMTNGAVRCWGSGARGALGRGDGETIGDDETPAETHPLLLTNVDECARGLDECAAEASCADTSLGFACACREGYEGDGFTCTDVDECANPVACGRGAVCRNTTGSHLCTCGPGYASDGYDCVDVDECAVLTPCSTSGLCTNRPGGFDCSCTLGTAGDGFSCSGVGSHVTQLSLGADHGCALVSNGAVRCWGDNFYGQLGYGHSENIGDDEVPYSVGDVPLDQPALGVAAGDFHSCALLEDGSVRCWGRNDAGQLGYGNTTTLGDDEAVDEAEPVELGGRAVQVVAGGEHTCALLDTGAVRCWGSGSAGVLGYGSTDAIGDDEVPTDVGSVPLGGTAVTLAAGRYHNCALLDSGTLRCWGHGLYGELGYGITTMVGDDETPASVGDVPIGGLAAQVAAGQFHSCAALVSGAVRCWGYGFRGALGSGSTQSLGNDELPADMPVVPLGAAVTALAAGYHHSCAILETGDVRCWGAGASGQLGLGATATLGDDEPVLSAERVELGGSRAFSIAAGALHTCAILSSRVYCWGANDRGQLGLGHAGNIGDDEPPTAGGPTLVLSP